LKRPVLKAKAPEFSGEEARGEEKLYYILGKTLGGRYLFIVVKPRGKGKAKVITARDMNDLEKRRYSIL